MFPNWEDDERELKERQKAAEAQKGRDNPVVYLDIEALEGFLSLWEGVASGRTAGPCSDKLETYQARKEERDEGWNTLCGLNAKRKNQGRQGPLLPRCEDQQATVSVMAVWKHLDVWRLMLGCMYGIVCCNCLSSRLVQWVLTFLSIYVEASTFG